MRWNVEINFAKTLLQKNVRKINTFLCCKIGNSSTLAGASCMTKGDRTCKRSRNMADFALAFGLNEFSIRSAVTFDPLSRLPFDHFLKFVFFVQMVKPLSNLIAILSKARSRLVKKWLEISNKFDMLATDLRVRLEYDNVNRNLILYSIHI